MKELFIYFIIFINIIEVLLIIGTGVGLIIKLFGADISWSEVFLPSIIGIASIVFRHLLGTLLSIIGKVLESKGL